MALAAIVLVVVICAPMVVVKAGGPRLARLMRPRFTNLRGKLSVAEATREYTLQRDSAITPAQAGASFNALRSPKDEPTKFSLISTPAPNVVPWREEPLPPEILPKSHSELYSGPDSRNILEVASRGLNRDDLDYLERIAHASAWRDFDRVARAPRVDLVGGRLALPFPDSVAIYDLPIIRYTGTKEYAYAGVSRAAYYLARNQKDSAEIALRAITSFGFAIVDNGTSLIDQLVGAVIVGIGRDALQRFYDITKDPRAMALKTVTDSAKASTVAEVTFNPDSGDSDRKTLIAIVHDEHMPRGLRFEMLNQLAMMPCTNVRELMLGPRNDVGETFSWARANLARYPAEVAQVDLSSRILNHEFSMDNVQSPAGGLASGIGSLSSTLLRNPRIASCTGFIAASMR